MEVARALSMLSLSEMKHIVNMVAVTSSFIVKGLAYHKKTKNVLTLLSQLPEDQRPGKALWLHIIESGNFPGIAHLENLRFASNPDGGKP